MNKVELEKPRSGVELVEWCDAKCNECAEDAHLRSSAMARKGLWKQFYDEVYPLAEYVRRAWKSSPEVVCRYVIGNDNYDAVLTTPGRASDQTWFVEITSAVEGYDEALRREAIGTKLCVGARGKMHASGPKGARKEIRSIQMAVRPEVGRAQALCLVKHAILSKTGRRYGKRHILVVAFDDMDFECSDAGLVRDFCTLYAVSHDLDFGELAVLGLRGRILVHIQPPRYRGKLTKEALAE